MLVPHVRSAAVISPRCHTGLSFSPSLSSNRELPAFETGPTRTRRPTTMTSTPTRPLLVVLTTCSLTLSLLTPGALGVSLGVRDGHGEIGGDGQSCLAADAPTPISPAVMAQVDGSSSDSAPSHAPLLVGPGAATATVGTADNSLLKRLSGGQGEGPVHYVSRAGVEKGWGHWMQQTDVYKLVFFYAPWCRYSAKMHDVMSRVASDLSTTQPNVAVIAIDGDADPSLRHKMGVETYPSVLMTTKDGSEVLARFFGAKKAFDVSNWVKDQVVGDRFPIVKATFKGQGQAA